MGEPFPLEAASEMDLATCDEHRPGPETGGDGAVQPTTPGRQPLSPDDEPDGEGWVPV